MRSSASAETGHETSVPATFDDVGSAGGHRGISLGIFADYDLDDATFLDIVERVVTRRLHGALGLDDEESGDV